MCACSKENCWLFLSIPWYHATIHFFKISDLIFFRCFRDSFGKISCYSSIFTPTMEQSLKSSFSDVFHVFYPFLMPVERLEI